MRHKYGVQRNYFMTLKGIDANYVPLMEDLGLKWYDQDDQKIEDIFYFSSQRDLSA